jgi:hypothetical protein
MGCRMKSLLPALLGAAILLPAAAWADDAKPAEQATTQQAQGCGMADSAFVNQNEGIVTINCAGVTPQFGSQLAGILTYVLQRRLDPEIVIAKLDEINGVPADNTPRNLTTDQAQALVQSLTADNKPATIAIVADPDEPDAGNYALAIATRLGMAGWQVAGSQISRTVPPGLEDIHGVVLVVHDEKKPPAMAEALKKAMAAAKIFLPIISRDDVAPDAATLWIGKRPTLNAAATQ